MPTVTGLAGLTTPWADVVITTGRAGALEELDSGAALEGGALESASLRDAGEFPPSPPVLLLVHADSASSRAAAPTTHPSHPARRDIRRRPVPTRCI